MVPDKRKKTAAENRRSRGPNSPWAQFGAKKAERTDRWHKAKYSSLPIKLQQFIKAHNTSYDALLALLAEHYDDGEPSTTHEASLTKVKQVTILRERDGVEGGGPSSSSSGQPMDPACKDLVCDALPLQPIAVAPPQPSVLPDEIDHPPDPDPLPRVDTGAKPRLSKSRRVATSSTPHQVNAHRVAVVWSSPIPTPPHRPSLRPPPMGLIHQMRRSCRHVLT